MSTPDENTVMGWGKHNAHADDGRDVDAEQDPPEEGWVYVYARQVPRTVLSKSMTRQVMHVVRQAYGKGIASGDVTRTILAAVGFLLPAPRPNQVADPFADSTCEALWPNNQGRWLQCEKDPHDDGPHSRGDEVWVDADANAIPAPVYSTEPPF
ncbi:hypothetical protein ACWD7M_16380 [Streptomyces griseus]